VERAKEISGEKLLRNIMIDNKIELYATYVSPFLFFFSLFIIFFFFETILAHQNLCAICIEDCN
jgi:hypothetical protein